MANLLFVIHGMGVHRGDEEGEAPWCDPIVSKLDEIASHYVGFDKDDNRFSRSVQIAPISYDELFRECLKTWNGNASQVQATIVEERIRHAPRIIEWLAAVDGQRQEEFFWSHVVDVLIYEYFDTIAKQVRLRVIDQILAAIDRARDEHNTLNVNFVAHSLGTAVLHDSLALLATQTNAKALEGPGYRFGSVFMLANVSRVLEDSRDEFCVYRTVVRPHTPSGRKHDFNFYVNVRHELDPIPAVRPFAPVDWGTDHYRDIQTRDIRAFNVHAFTHYLEDPQVHRPLLGFAASRASLRPANGPYSPDPPRCVAALNAFRSEARALQALMQDHDSPFDLIKVAAQFLALAEKARTDCTRERNEEE